MLGMSMNLFAHDKYSEEFRFSPDKSTVSSFFVTTSFEVLNTWELGGLAQYYCRLNERSDTIIRNVTVSPTGRYNYPGDSLAYSWSKFFAKARVFHREFVVDRDIKKINAEITEGEPIHASFDSIIMENFKFSMILFFLLFLSCEKEKNIRMTAAFICFVLIIAFTVIGTVFVDSIKMPLFDYFFIMFLVLLPPLLVSLQKLGVFREIKARLIMNKAMRDMDKGDYP